MHKQVSHITDTNTGKPVPKAKGLPVIGLSLDAARDPLSVLKKMSTIHGSVMKLRLGLKDYYLLQSPTAAKQVLQANARNYCKPGAAKLMKRVLGSGLATSNGALWLQQRRLIQPAFHRNQLGHFQSILEKEISILISDWKRAAGNKAIDVSKAFLRLTMNNLTKAMFGMGIEKEMENITRLLDRMLQFSSNYSKSLIKVPLYIPLASNRSFLQAERQFDSIIHSLITQRREELKTGTFLNTDNLLNLLLTVSESNTNPVMTAKQLRDEITTIFMAGHETTSQTLSWAFYRIASQPEIYQKLREEILQTPEGDSSFGLSTSLPYTTALLEETMRFYPPVWIMARKALAADCIEGYHVPAGATLLINVYGLHHHPDFWQSPDFFSPVRFCMMGDKAPPPFSYLPFGGGQRLCIGQHFAMQVMLTVIVHLVKQFRFSVPLGMVPSIDANVVLRSKENIQLFVQTNSTYASSQPNAH